MYRSILVPLDESGFGEHALPYALRIACRHSATVMLAYVCTPSDGKGAEYATPTALRAMQIYLHELADWLRHRWLVNVECCVLSGPVVETLVAYVSSSDTQLVVMTTHARSGLDRVQLGSVAESLVQHLDTPILLVRPTQSEPQLHKPVSVGSFRRVLIPLDGSELAERVIGEALVVTDPHLSEFVLLTAADRLWETSSIFAEARHGAMPTRERHDACAYLDRVAMELRARGLLVRTHAVEEPVGPSILDAARSNIDLIAMTTHGRGGVSRLMLGSVASYVLRHTTVPLLLQHAARGASSHHRREGALPLADEVWS